MSTIEDKENIGSEGTTAGPHTQKILELNLDGYDSAADVEYNPHDETNDATDDEMDVSTVVIPDEEIADVLTNLTENEQQEIQKKYPEVMEIIQTTQENKFEEPEENIATVDLNGYDSSADTDYNPLDNTTNTVDTVDHSDDDVDMTGISEAEIDDIRTSFPVKTDSASDKPVLRSTSGPAPSGGDLLANALEGYDSNADDDYAEETAESDDSSADELDESVLQADEVKSLRQEITESMGVKPDETGAMKIRSGKSIEN